MRESVRHEISADTPILQQATLDSAFRWFELLFLLPGEEQETVRGSLAGEEGGYQVRRSRTRPTALPPESSYEQRLLRQCSSEQDVRLALGEFLYLWARDAIMEESLRRVLKDYLTQLNMTPRVKEHDPLARVTISSYQFLSLGPASGFELPTEVRDEAWVYRAYAISETDIRQGVLRLPTVCILFRLEFEISARSSGVFSPLIGNAIYRVDHKIDPVTGKRSWLLVEGEDGACVGLSRLFQDLYNAEEE